MKRLLESFDSAIAQSRIPREMPLLRAERAVIYARLGELDLARQEVVSLRALPKTEAHASLAAWLWLAEGLADYYDNLGASARDRVQRALGLAATLRVPRLHALAAAWLAHMDFRVHDYAAMIEHLRLALRLAADDHHSARARVCTVMACATHYIGREDLAQPWYTAARHHAYAEGDGATLSSIMFNMALMRIVCVRVDDAFGQRDEVAMRRALMSAEASVFLDQSLEIKALSHHPAMLRAQLLTVQGAYAEALAIYERDMAPAMDEGLAHAECLYQADRAMCLLELGRSDEALVAARRAGSVFIVATEIEERAVAHAMLARVFGRLGLTDEAQRELRDAAEVYAELQASRVGLVTALESSDLQRYSALATTH